MDERKEENSRNLPAVYSENQIDEEAGAEIAPGRPDGVLPDHDRTIYRTDQDQKTEQQGTGWGLGALILSILSLLFAPFILGTAGIILGYMAIQRGSRGLGLWAIVIGVISVLSSIFLAPYFG